MNEAEQPAEVPVRVYAGMDQPPEGSTPQDIAAEIKRTIWIGPSSQSRL